MYVGPSAATGIGAAGAATALGLGMPPLFLALAIFTLIGAGFALARALPRRSK